MTNMQLVSHCDLLQGFIFTKDTNELRLAVTMRSLD